MALFNNDSINNKEGNCKYLRRSAQLMAETVVPPLKGTIMGTRADKSIRLVVDASGPYDNLVTIFGMSRNIFMERTMSLLSTIGP